MEKKILIAVDESWHSENALRYAALTHQQVAETAFDLLHVQPTVPQYLIDEAKTKPKARAQLEKLFKLSRNAALAMLQKYKAQLVSLGVSEARVSTITLPRRFGVAKDILEYSAAMRYDAILMGRRGLSGLTEIFAGSVSASIIANAAVTPIWLVEGTAPSTKVMIAVDGSDSALKAVDHMAFILEKTPGAWIEFYHVVPRLQDVCPVDFDDIDSESLEGVIHQGDQACIDRFFARARQVLSRAGIDDNQFTVTTEQGTLRVGKSILKAYHKGGFGTLVIGRRGMNKAFFGGSVSRYLINNFSGGALWVVP